MSFLGSRLLPYPLPGPQPSEAGARRKRRTKAHREAVRRRKEIRIAPGGGGTLPGGERRLQYLAGSVPDDMVRGWPDIAPHKAGEEQRSVAAAPGAKRTATKRVLGPRN